MPHHSDSAVQRDAEETIRALVSEQIGTPLTRGQVTFGPDATPLAVDGVSPDESVLVEIFARLGKLKGAQEKKVGLDAFRLITLKQSRPGARLILVFADEPASVYARTTGWLAKALQLWEIEVMVVAIPDDLRARLLAAQLDQRDALTAPI